MSTAVKKQEDRLLKPDEVAGILGTTERTLSGWRTRGYGPKYIKSGMPGANRASVRYRMSDIQEYIKNGGRDE